MPPRLPEPSALCAWAARTPLRAFSTTASCSAPRPPHPNHHLGQHSNNSSFKKTSTSSSSLLDLAGPSHHRHQPSRPRQQQQQHLAKPPSSSSSKASAASDAANRLLDRFRSRAQTHQQSRQAQVDMLREVQTSNEYMAQNLRQPRRGDIYSPADLGPLPHMKMKKSRRWFGDGDDVVELLGVNPLDMYKNYAFLSSFMYNGGGIKHSKWTGLSNVNQRKVARMIRRAQGMGLNPTNHNHPELLREKFFKL